MKYHVTYNLVSFNARIKHMYHFCWNIPIYAFNSFITSFVQLSNIISSYVQQYEHSRHNQCAQLNIEETIHYFFRISSVLLKNWYSSTRERTAFISHNFCTLLRCNRKNFIKQSSSAGKQFIRQEIPRIKILLKEAEENLHYIVLELILIA